MNQTKRKGTPDQKYNIQISGRFILKVQKQKYKEI